MTSSGDRGQDGNDPDLAPGLLSAVAAYWWLVALAVLLSAAVGYVHAVRQPALYASTGMLLLADPRSQSVLTEPRQAAGDPNRYVRNQVELAVSEPVRARAAGLLESEGWGPLVSVSATPGADVDSIILTAVDPDPERAAAVADAVGRAYEQFRTEQSAASAAAALAEISRARGQVTQQLADIEGVLARNPDDTRSLAERDAASQQLQILTARAQQLTVDAALFGGGVQVREPATVSSSPFQPRPVRTASAAGVLGLVAASAFAWWQRTRRQAKDARSQTDHVLGAPQLAEIPTFDKDVGPFPVATAPLMEAAEAYRFLSAALTVAMRRREASTLLITSAGPGEGKTSTVVNLGLACNRDGRQVILVDADARGRGLSHATGASAGVALPRLSRGGVTLQSALGAGRRPGLEHLRVASLFGTDLGDDSAAFLRTPAFRLALTRLGKLADLVVIDSPPLLAVADAFEIASQVDAVIVVVSPGTSAADLEEVRRRLDLAGANLVGYVKNRAGEGRSSVAYGSSSYFPADVADHETTRTPAHGRPWPAERSGVARPARPINLLPPSLRTAGE